MNTTTQNQNRRRSARFVSLILFIALLLQIVSVCCFAIGGNGVSLGGLSNNSGIVNGIGNFDSDETIKALKKSLISSLNKDLLQKVEDYELRGEVSVIISFSEDSLITDYTGSSAANRMSFSEYSQTSAAKKLKD